MTDERQIDDTTVMEKDGSGNLVIKNIDEAAISKLAAALDANGQDINNVGAFDSDSVNTDVLNINDKQAIASGGFVDIQSIQPQTDIEATTTSTSYATIEVGNGFVDLENIPPAATGYIRYIARIKNDTSSETTTSRPQLGDTNGQLRSMNEVEVSTTSTSFQFLDSGWTNIQNAPLDETYRGDYELKVSGGTGTIDPTSTGILVGWQIE